MVDCRNNFHALRPHPPPHPTLSTSSFPHLYVLKEPQGTTVLLWLQPLPARYHRDLTCMTRPYADPLSLDLMSMTPPPLDLMSMTPPPLDLMSMTPPPLDLMSMTPPSLDLMSMTPPPLDLMSMTPPPLDLMSMTPPPLDLMSMTPPPLDLMTPPPLDLMSMTPPPLDLMTPPLRPYAPPAPYSSTASRAVGYPSCLHTTRAFEKDQRSLHTVPHWLLWYTSTRPLSGLDPFTSLTARSGDGEEGSTFT